MIGKWLIITGSILFVWLSIIIWKGPFTDFWFIHADAFRNASVMVLIGSVLIWGSVFLTRIFYIKKAYRDVSDSLRQRNVELTITNRHLRETNDRQWAELERLYRIQKGAVAAADTIHELAREQS